MRSSYKKLGPYVRELKVRNSDGACGDLRGVSINKEFMPSVANVHGTDLSKYKRVKKHQFAFNPMHVGRDEVLPIALLSEDEPVIVSPAYVVFEVRDHEKLLPEYLMMWCRRPEFDRNAWFTTDSSVRGGFSWDNFCNMELPIPSIEKQREIEKEYRAVVDRIRLNERLNEKLEEAAQAIYKHWFVDFEFPMTAEYAQSIGKPELAGQPYKSSGGEMEYNEVLEQGIPKGWSDAKFTDAYILGGGGTPDTNNPEYWGGNIPFFTPKDTGRSFYSVETEKTVTEDGVQCSSTKIYPAGTIFITCRGTVGNVAIASRPMAMNQSCYAVSSKDADSVPYTHQQTMAAISIIKHHAVGGVFGALVTNNFASCMIQIPNKKVRAEFNRLMQIVYGKICLTQQEAFRLSAFSSILLSRLAIFGER